MQVITILKPGKVKTALTSAAFLLVFFAIEVSAQVKNAPVPPKAAEPQESYIWWYVTLVILFLGLAGAIFWMLESRRSQKDPKNSKKDKTTSQNSDWDSNSFDADKELEWFRQNKKTVGKSSKNGKSPKKKNLADGLPQTSKILKRGSGSEEEITNLNNEELREKLANLQTSQLPIFKFQKLELARPFAPLSISNDEAVMSAIEQTHDEYEEDEDVRDLAVRILARFKTRNSVEALSQMALYDLSSNLRSKAVSILADFDHESVFEAILQACADPTREVRAAAARGLFRLSFDRSDAWTRIAETNDVFRMRQAVRAAIEADLVSRSFDRLVHPDQKTAYEAVALLSLMIRADETQLIYKALETHKDKNVKLAILRVLELTKGEHTPANLAKLLEKPTVSKELKDKIIEVIQSFEMIPA